MEDSKDINGKNNTGIWSCLLNQEENSEKLSNDIAKMLKSKYDEPSSAYNADVTLLDDNWNVNISEEEVFNGLKSLSWKKSTGIENIPTRIDSETADLIAKPLKGIYDASIKQRCFPQAWKTAIITPVPKTTPPTVDKIRPISTFPVISKVFERIVLNKMWKTIELSLGEDQHGFRPQHSTTTALIDITENAFHYYDDSATNGVAIMSLDMTSAFDSINYNLLIQKLQQLKLPSGFIRWLFSYLQDRHFTVKIRGSFSNPNVMRNGIPQGSVFGPTLFSIFTNDMSPQLSSTKQVKYADDIYSILPIFRDKNISDDIQIELESTEEWCKDNRIILNKDKSKILLCQRSTSAVHDRLPLPIVTEMNVLGVILNNKLTWDHHIANVVKKCNRRFFILRKLKRFVNVADLKMVYSGMIQSTLEYACPIFIHLPKRLERKIESVDYRAFKLINQGTGNTKIHRQQHSYFRLQHRRELISKRLFRKLADNKNHILHKYVPKRLLHSKHYRLQLTRTERYRLSFFPLTSTIMNRK